MCIRKCGYTTKPYRLEITLLLLCSTKSIVYFSQRSSQLSVGRHESLCDVCSEQRATITFQPCQHKVVCGECCIKMKKCIECKMPITAKIDEGKRFFSHFQIFPEHCPLHLCSHLPMVCRQELFRPSALIEKHLES